MADYKVTDTQLTNIANAIRTKGGTSEELEFPTEFISAVNAISGVTAADEGKVVSNGVLVAQQSGSATTNGTVDTTIINSLSVNVPQTVVMPISLTVTPPTKAEYEVGDTLDLTGIAVVANYSDGTTAVVTGSCTFSPDDGYTLDTAGNITITATYNGTGSVSGGSYSVQLTGTTSVHVTVVIDIVPWSTGTDEQITAMIQAAHRGDIDLQTDGGWAVGNVRTITVGAFTAGGKSFAQQNLRIAITEFGDYMNSGSVLQFDFIDMPSTALRMNASSVSDYETSEMKISTLPAMVEALPAWLQLLLVEFSVLVGVGNGSSSVKTVTGNKLALRSMIEVYGTNKWSADGEGVHVSYYNSDSRKGKSDGWYWLRSPNLSYPKQYNLLSFSGGWRLDPDRMDATDGSWGRLSPFGCL